MPAQLAEPAAPFDYYAAAAVDGQLSNEAFGRMTGAPAAPGGEAAAVDAPVSGAMGGLGGLVPPPPPSGAPPGLAAAAVDMKKLFASLAGAGLLPANSKGGGCGRGSIAALGGGGGGVLSTPRVSVMVSGLSGEMNAVRRQALAHRGSRRSCCLGGPVLSSMPTSGFGPVRCCTGCMARGLCSARHAACASRLARRTRCE